MSETTVKTKLTNTESEHEEKVVVKLFKITDIPKAMKSIGWKESARFMSKWFSDPYYEMTLSEKLNKSDMSKINKTHILDDLDFDWLMTSSTRVKPIVDQLISDLSNIYEFSNYVGKQKAVLNQLSNGLRQLMSRIEKIGLLDLTTKSLNNGILDYSNLSAIELDKISQFNFIRVGSTTWEKYNDELDDVYGALGSFIIKMAVTQGRTIKNNLGQSCIEINEIGLYVRDTYDFMNEAGKADQPLGYWCENGVIKPGLVDYMIDSDVITKDGVDYFLVTNGSFEEYRKLQASKPTPLTGDFFVYSTVKKIPVNIVIHLNDIDYEEYNDRKGE